METEQEELKICKYYEFFEDIVHDTPKARRRAAYYEALALARVAPCATYFLDEGEEDDSEPGEIENND